MSEFNVDFKSNKIFQLDDNITAQTILKLNGHRIMYHQGDLLHIYNPGTKIADSIKIDLSRFVALPYPVIEPTFSYFYFIGIAIVLIGLIILYTRQLRRKKIAKKTIPI